MSNSNSNRSDHQLIRQTLDGDTEAFGYLVQKYQDRLFNGIVIVMRNPQEAEDVVQEAFVLAYTKLISFRGHSAFFTWLYRIAYNLAISRLRRQKKHLSLERQRETNGLDLSDTEVSPSANIEHQEQMAQLEQAMGRLTEEHRSILVLREIEGMDYEAIAEILDLPIGTVRSRLHRARDQLKEKLISIEKSRL